MSEVEIPEYVPGAPWKAVIRLDQDRVPVIVRIWAVGNGGAPHHADVLIALGAGAEGIVCVSCLDPEGLRTEIHGPTDQCEAIEPLLRERIPSINFEPEEIWDFGVSGPHHDSP